VAWPPTLGTDPSWHVHRRVNKEKTNAGIPNPGTLSGPCPRRQHDTATPEPPKFGPPATVEKRCSIGVVRTFWLHGHHARQGGYVTLGFVPELRGHAVSTIEADGSLVPGPQPYDLSRLGEEKW
jgi:hypothetical protein